MSDACFVLLFGISYTAPPYGPKTCLNRTSYGVHGGGLFGQTLERVSKMKNGPIMAGLVAGICAICYLPLGTCHSYNTDARNKYSKLYE
eukprot:scaffold614_cov163-Amphora_coffeaeformis.AAC.1